MSGRLVFLLVAGEQAMRVALMYETVRADHRKRCWQEWDCYRQDDVGVPSRAATQVVMAPQRQGHACFLEFGTCVLDSGAGRLRLSSLPVHMAGRRSPFAAHSFFQRRDHRPLKPF